MDTIRHRAEIHEYLEGQREGIIKHLRQLVAIDTHVPPGHNYDVICRAMADRFAQYGCETGIH